MDLAIPFVGVGTGVATIVAFRNPRALVPHPPYIAWLFTVAAICAFALLLAMGLEDGWEEDDEVDGAQRWRALAAAYVAGLIASVTFVATVALIDRID